MISNLRARPIQGFVTDSAGNVIRNASISISRNDPSGAVTVDRATSDDEGYFISNPLQNGIYDILESGIVTSRIIHSPDRVSIPCFKASKYNYYDSDVFPFSSLVEDEELNKYKYFLQIEPEDVNVDILGSTFPIYEKSLSGLYDDGSDLYHMHQFFNFSDDARITIPRFDIEYYQPLTTSQLTYRRIKWAGVPGIRYKADSKIVVPLDYFSIVANNPFIISREGNEFYSDNVTIESFTDPIMIISGIVDDQYYLDFHSSIGIGDIVKVKFKSISNYWYGIVLEKPIGSSYKIVLEKWLSSRFTSITAPADDTSVGVLRAYHGIFQGMAGLSSTVSDYFTVAENLHQQTVENELYNYSEWTP